MSAFCLKHLENSPKYKIFVGLNGPSYTIEAEEFQLVAVAQKFEQPDCGIPSFHSDVDGFGETVKEITGSVIKNYLYRADERMNGYQSGTMQAAYYFDALGRRVAKVIDTGSGPFTQSFVHLDKEDRILLGKAGDGTITTFIDGQRVDEHLAEVTSGTGKGYIMDHLGSVLNGDAAGSNHVFGLFGESASLIPTASSNPVQYGFAGRELDESGNYYNRLRAYSPSVGRFLAQDPLGLAGEDANLYRYVKNEPTEFVDPFGEKLVFLDSATQDLFNALRQNADAEERGFFNELDGDGFTVEIGGISSGALDDYISRNFPGKDGDAYAKHTCGSSSRIRIRRSAIDPKSIKSQALLLHELIHALDIKRGARGTLDEDTPENYQRWFINRHK